MSSAPLVCYAEFLVFYSLLATGYSLLFLSRRPGHLAAAEQMQMQMVHRLPAVFAGIHDDAVAFARPFLRAISAATRIR